MSTPRILWYVFHPNLAESRGNRTLMTAAEGVPELTFVDAYAEYPDFQIDVAKEQDRLREHDLIVFQHPFYWYSCPALFKEWQDRVLEYGFAYPPKEGTALHGKHWLSVITTGGSQDAYQSGGYNNYSMSELLKPLQQTANLCGMRYHPPFVVHSVLPADYEGIRATRDDELQNRVRELRAWIDAFDPAERHSLEPLVPPHYLAAMNATAT